MIDFDSFLEKTKQSMASKYRVSLSVDLPDGSTADLTASRTYFTWKGLCILSQHLFITRMDNAQVDDMKKLFETGFDFGKGINRVPLLRGMQFGYMIVPIIATSNPSKALLEYAVSQPRKHWAIFEFPVVLDLESGEAHYFRQKFVWWGGFYFSDIRKVVSRYIESTKE